jgi:TetR/AcrR family transcriptional repressor of nem operon
MARPRTYDEDIVIGKALEVFWEKGFSETSSRDLIAATGISNGSLFNRYGDKNKLYLACLQKYEAVYVAALERLLVSNLPFKQKIKEVFEGTAKKVAATGSYEGCFFFNSSVDSGIDDDSISSLTRAIHRRLEKAFRTATEQAKEVGELNVDSDSSRLAGYLMTITTGLRALVRAGTPASGINRNIHSALELLPF